VLVGRTASGAEKLPAVTCIADSKPKIGDVTGDKDLMATAPTLMDSNTTPKVKDTDDNDDTLNSATIHSTDSATSISDNSRNLTASTSTTTNIKLVSTQAMAAVVPVSRLQLQLRALLHARFVYSFLEICYFHLYTLLHLVLIGPLRRPPPLA